MNILKKIYNDFLRPSKEEDYEKIIKTARDFGYEFHTVLSFEEVIRNYELEKKYLVLRRDVDTADNRILRKFLEIEKRYGARCSYYFRWSTVNIELMHNIEKAGGEASYHYEQVASYCYKHHIRNKEDMLKKIEIIRNCFVSDYDKFRKNTGLPCKTIASHGEFINVRFNYQNKEIVNDSVRNKCGFIREAYDEEHMQLLTCRIVDHEQSDFFTENAIAAIKRGESCLELLTHPRQWNSPFFVNLWANVRRIALEVYMR